MWFCAFDLVLWLSWSGEGAPEEHVFSPTPTKACLQRPFLMFQCCFLAAMAGISHQHYPPLNLGQRVSFLQLTVGK